MVRKIFLLAAAVLFLQVSGIAIQSGCLTAQDAGAEEDSELGNSTNLEYVPYTSDEFPDWAHKLRRAESIAFGSFPLAYSAVSLGFMISGSSGTLSTDDYITRLAIAGIVSVSLACIDFILGELESN